MTSSSDSVDAAPPWVELPREITATILLKLGTIGMLKAEAVCTTWRSVCKDPGLWRSIDMHFTEVEMCCLAVDRSQGQLNDIKIQFFGTDEMLLYISQRCGRLRSLQLKSCYDITDEGLIEAVKNLPLPEELHIYYNPIRAETIETVGRTCENVKSFKLNRHVYIPYRDRYDFEALAIAKNMPELRHLQICGSDLTDDGLLLILDGCSKLESLYLFMCFNLHFGENLRRLCAQRIKDLKVPQIMSLTWLPSLVAVRLPSLVAVRLPVGRTRSFSLTDDGSFYIYLDNIWNDFKWVLNGILNIDSNQYLPLLTFISSVLVNDSTSVQLHASRFIVVTTEVDGILVVPECGGATGGLEEGDDGGDKEQS
ncbi:hypothetical protein RD792_003881 [Penstemon davidsonii]|uniref:F-box domain-containing protein n=1 Tax=Penstemon davidsonii TaxID=160366 RepID=A0ABR0DFW8_9LAMI|nr:hypothetical protein RD792_003881 [Penstemon davidsonii]